MSTLRYLSSVLSSEQCFGPYVSDKQWLSRLRFEGGFRQGHKKWLYNPYSAASWQVSNARVGPRWPPRSDHGRGKVKRTRTDVIVVNVTRVTAYLSNMTHASVGTRVACGYAPHSVLDTSVVNNVNALYMKNTHTFKPPSRMCQWWFIYLHDE